MDPLKILEKHYDKNSKLYDLLILHSTLVTKKAIEIAKKVPELKPDLKFIKEAGMLHDIGIKFVDSPKINCFGKHKYLEHGYLGRDLLDSENLPKHALVCERHIGVGITKKEIIETKLPLPKRDMIPISIEEKIISVADLFYTKAPGFEKIKRTIDEIKKNISKHGEEKVKKFENYCKMFKLFSY